MAPKRTKEEREARKKAKRDELNRKRREKYAKLRPGLMLGELKDLYPTKRPSKKKAKPAVSTPANIPDAGMWCGIIFEGPETLL